MLDAALALLGRTHPLALHIPIGSFAALVVFELLAWLRGRPLELHIRLTLTAIIFLSATLSVVSGLLLAGEPGYSGDTLTQHKVSGIAFACLSLLMLAAAVKRHHRSYLSTFLAAAGLMTVAGHLGANMTHGDDFLTAPIEQYFSPKATRAARGGPALAPNAPAPEQPEASTRFDRLIRPILQQTCVSCHGESKTKGGLAVHTYEALMAGGDTGPSIIAGDPENSEFIIRMRLPIDDEDHMPPAKKPQPSEAQIKLIEAWIKAGATLDGDFEGAQAATNAPPVAQTTPGNAQTTPSPAPGRQSAAPTAVNPEIAAAVAALRARLVHVESFDPATTLLAVDLSPAAGLVPTSELTTLLTPLASTVGQLTLSRISIDETLVALVARMTNLRVLAASGTAITQSHLASLSALAQLESLTLTQSKLTDEAAPVLMKFAALKTLHAWNSGLSAQALAPLSDKGVRVDLGAATAAKPIETEADFKLTSDAPPVGAAAAPATGTGIARPTNTTCPITGAAVNGDIVVVYKGKATAVCCEKCASKVLAESLAKP